MIQDAFMLAKSFGYLTYWEVIGLKAIAGMIPAGSVCVNLGAGSGTSSLAVCEDRPDLIDTFYSVDISASSPLGGLENERMAFLYDDITEFPKQILGDTIQVGKTWGGGKITYLFIDDDHSYEHLSEELGVYLPLLADDAIIAFHDYGRKEWPGVKQAVDEHIELEQILLLSTLIAFKKGNLISVESYAPHKH